MFAIRVTLLFLTNIFLIEFGTKPVFCFTREEFADFKGGPNFPDLRTTSTDDLIKICDKAVLNDHFADIQKPLKYTAGYPQGILIRVVFSDDGNEPSDKATSIIHCGAEGHKLYFGRGQSLNGTYSYDCDDSECSGKFDVPNVLPI